MGFSCRNYPGYTLSSPLAPSFLLLVVEAMSGSAAATCDYVVRTRGGGECHRDAPPNSSERSLKRPLVLAGFSVTCAQIHSRQTGEQGQFVPWLEARLPGFKSCLHLLLAAYSMPLFPRSQSGENKSTRPIVLWDFVNGCVGRSWNILAPGCQQLYRYDDCIIESSSARTPFAGLAVGLACRPGPLCRRGTPGGSRAPSQPGL